MQHISYKFLINPCIVMLGLKVMSRVSLVIIIIVNIILLGVLFFGSNRTTPTKTVIVTVTSSPSIANQSATLTPVAGAKQLCWNLFCYFINNLLVFFYEELS